MNCINIQGANYSENIQLYLCVSVLLSVLKIYELTNFGSPFPLHLRVTLVIIKHKGSYHVKNSKSFSGFRSCLLKIILMHLFTAIAWATNAFIKTLFLLQSLRFYRHNRTLSIFLTHTFILFRFIDPQWCDLYH